MTGTYQFGLVVLVIGLVGIAAVLSNRLSARLRVPAPAFFLICASVAAQLWPHATLLPIATVERVVTVALAIILFDGGMHIGWRRDRRALRRRDGLAAGPAARYGGGRHRPGRGLLGVRPPGGRGPDRGTA